MDGIAIVGMACIFPGAPSLEAYWQNILAKVDAVGEPPADWDAARYLDPTSTDNDRVYTTRGGYLGDLARFNPVEYGVMPNSVDGGEPDHFLAIRVAHEALADAGYRDRPFDRARTEVVLGRGTYINRGYTTLVQHGLVVDQTLAILKQLEPRLGDADLRRLKQELKASLPPFSAETAPGLVPNIVSGRIANRLDLMGPNYTVDAACASALVALDIAVRDLAGGRVDMALVGGVHVSTPAPIHMIFCQLGALSRRERIRPFDASADGTLMGEGLGIVVLKRAADAVRDGDRIYAVVRAVGTASDGRALGLLAPRLEGEVLALRRAYAECGVDPGTVALVEAHGTATPVGDATEIQALGQVFGARAGEPTCALGSVKSMIGHTLPAAGMAGLIKAALALYHGVLPPTLCDEPSPKLGLERTPFYLNTETRPWIHGAVDRPRRAGVNAFGFGGINAHAVLEEYASGGPPRPSLDRRWDSEALILDGADRAALVERARQVRDYLERVPDVALVDLAFTLNAERLSEGAGERLAVVARDAADARQKLEHALDRLARPDTRRIKDLAGIYYFAEPLGGGGKRAFLFPGEGSQYEGMLADVCRHFPEARAWFDLMDRAFAGHPRGYLPSQVIFPPPTGRASGESRLFAMDSGAEAVFTASQALLALLGSLGIRPDAVVGHSTGEYSALLAAGALATPDDAALIGAVRRVNATYAELAAAGRIPGGVLIAVGNASPEVLRAVTEGSRGEVQVAMDNCPHQVVLCATEGAAPAALAALQADGAVANVLPMGRAYHTERFGEMSRALGAVLEGLPVIAPRVPVYSCVTAAPYPSEPAEIRRLAARQWAAPVRFRETVEAMYADGVRVFVEVGPRNNLTAFVEDILRRKPSVVIAANTPQRSGIGQLNHLVALLAAHHVPLDATPLYARRSPRRLGLDPVADRRPASAPGMTLSLGLAPLRLSPSTGPLISDASQAHAVGSERAAPHAAASPPSAASATTPGPPADIAAEPRSVAMKQYLATMNEFLATQEAVMRGFLAGAPPALLSATPKSAPEAKSDPVVAPAGLPFADAVVSRQADALVIERVIDVAEDRFLLDHTLGGAVSDADSSLTALPVMPLTMSMEILAEAAAALAPGQLVIGMRDVRAYRFMAFDAGALALRVSARRTAPDRVRVEAREASGAPGTPIVEAEVVLADRYPEAPVAPAFPLRGARPSRWSPERLYAEGMFHGPSFRAVLSVDRWGEDGLEATLGALPDDALFTSRRAPGFVIDPVVLDAAGQLVGYWTAEHLRTGFNVFPYQLASLELFGPPLCAPERARSRARIALVGAAQVTSDIDVVDGDGRVRMRLLGWEDRRFDLPSGFSRLRIDTRGALMSERWDACGLGQGDGVACCRVGPLADDFLTSGAGIWPRVLAGLVLSRAERLAWARLDRPPAARVAWLLGRLAAKDAVRLLMEKRQGLALRPADVEIANDADGRPRAGGAWTAQVDRVPLVSLAHVDGLAVGLAADPGEHAGIGVDVERAGRLTDDGVRVAFADAEQSRLGALPGDRLEWALRAWCAKEAAGKALGRGLGGDPRSLAVEDVDARTGRMVIRPSARAIAEAGAADLALSPVCTARDGEAVVAISLCQRKGA